MQNEKVGPCVQKLLRISRQQQQNTKPSVGPSVLGALCDCPGPHQPAGEVFMVDTLEYAVRGNLFL